MISINVNTKISTLLKQNPAALDAIVSISPKFNKLKNPLLRKLMASRATISMASKIGGCSVNDFFEKLKPLGFTIDNSTLAEENTPPSSPVFIKNVRKEDIFELDVRPTIESGKDPLNLIIEKTETLKSGQVLKIINTFEPAPLILLLSKQGFDSFSETINENLVYTYFLKTRDIKKTASYTNDSKNGSWDETLKRFDGKINRIDVRHLGMPLPMLTILEELEKLPGDKALLVHHKRIPVFLLPELQERKFEYRIKGVSDCEVHLLIFKS